MDRSTIRIGRSTHALVRRLADEERTTMAGIVDRAVADYHRHRFWADYRAAYAALRANPPEMADLRREAAIWDTTHADGLEDGLHRRSE
jgi:hypothetical protein